MKFSIRDLFLVTMIVALAVAWWVDRSRLTRVIENQNADAKELAEFSTAKAREAEAMLKAYLKSLPNSSAPAPNPPKS